jgi:hypothetical protein
VTLTEIKRRLHPGQAFAVTNHRVPELGTVIVRVRRKSGDYAFYVEHALGESKINWPPARHVTRDEDGTLHLNGTGEHAGKAFLTLVPIGRSTASHLAEEQEV